MTKLEFLDSLPNNRKVTLYRNYLEYNRYLDELEQFCSRNLDVRSIVTDFNSNVWDIQNLVDGHSSLLKEEEWETYKNLEECGY